MVRAMIVRLAVAACAVAGGAVQAEAQQVAAGPSRFEMAEAAGATAAPLAVFLYRPAAWTAADRILIVMHGLQRDADRYRDEWERQAERGNLLVVVPEFSAAKFPGRATYNFGNVVDAENRPQPPERWVFGVIDRVFDEVRRRTGATRTSYFLFGHSAGAQFVHRYLLLAPTTRADLIVVANAGSYSMPTADVAFPFGLGGVPVTAESLRAVFARRVVVLLGDQDTNPNHPSLPRDPEAMAQGPHRFARGHAFFAAAQAAAERLGAPFAWRLEIVPGVGHSDAGMAARAVELFRAE
jgi:poly(3-hydroxybutyrate) depolymerase